MSTIKLSSDEIEMMRLLEKRTGAVARDCIITDTDITFIVAEGQAGLAIGKKGAIINELKKEIGKEVHVYEHSDDNSKFIANLLYPIKVEKVEISGNEAKVYINPDERKRAIGRGGKKINTVKELAGRHTNIENITIA